MSLIATGVIVRVHATGAEFGMHDACADKLMSALIEAGEDVMTGMSAVIIGPLFSEDWTCAHSGCSL